MKKIRDTKGTFHAKMGTIKDRNGAEVTEAESIRKMDDNFLIQFQKAHVDYAFTINN